MTDRKGEMAMDEQDYLDREAGLERGLTKAQIIMIGLGGAIGIGLFMASGVYDCTDSRDIFHIADRQPDGWIRCGAACGL